MKIKYIRLADPLYLAQQAIYKICGKEKDFSTQDGELLNFLGSHMRKINPNVLQEHFSKSLNNITSDIDLIICMDVRPKDISFVKKEDFFLVNISAPPTVTLQRRKNRNDLSLGSSHHPTEQGLSPKLIDAHIENNGTLDEFKEKVKFLITRVMK